MSRAEKNPLTIPKGVEVKIEGNVIKVKGTKGVLEYAAHGCVEIKQEDNLLKFASKKDINIDESNGADAIVGTMRALLKNMLDGVSKGFERKLILVGVGFRAQVQGKILNLAIGFSHPVKYDIPAGITIETPSQTEILIKGVDKQLVGQVAAQIRDFRPPEPYKGKGIRYDGEVIALKEGKKK